jgi:hypothetical protein
MYHTTGMTRKQLREMSGLIEDFHGGSIPHCPPSVITHRALQITATYLRTARTREDLAETFGTSQSTISRVIDAVTTTLKTLLAYSCPLPEDLHADAIYIIDGTLLPCWLSWRAHPQLYSGKHKTTGYNIQIAVTLSGTLAWVSDPVDGSRHDMHALTQSHVLDGLDLSQWIGDKGYIGAEIHTPTRKPTYRDLTETEKATNEAIHKIRWIVERAVAHLKNWKILAHDYRRPLKTFADTISAVLGLHFHLQAG